MCQKISGKLRFQTSLGNRKFVPVSTQRLPKNCILFYLTNFSHAKKVAVTKCEKGATCVIRIDSFAFAFGHVLMNNVPPQMRSCFSPSLLPSPKVGNWHLKMAVVMLSVSIHGPFRQEAVVRNPLLSTLTWFSVILALGLCDRVVLFCIRGMEGLVGHWRAKLERVLFPGFGIDFFLG